MENTIRPALVLVGIVALCNTATARPQDFRPSRLITSYEPGFFSASDARSGFRRDGRSFDSSVVPSQLTEYKGQIITGQRPGSFESSSSGDTHVVRGSYNVGLPQGIKQTIIKYKETPGLSALPVNGKSQPKKSSTIAKVIYGAHKERPLSPEELYIITAARRKEEAATTTEVATTERHANADKSFRKPTFR